MALANVLMGYIMAFTLTSAAFQDGQNIPERFTCDGADRSPELSWTLPPENTKSFALICDDPDAPGKTWVHWVIYNIPKDVRLLPEGIAPEEGLADTTRQGSNDFQRIGYGGPCPPKGPAHRYFFTLYALDTVLLFDSTPTKATLEQAMNGHILAKTQIMGTYSRK